MQEENELLQKIITFIDSQEILDKPCIKLMDKPITETGLDSLELVDLSLGLEKQFNRRINFDKIDDSSTLKSLINDLEDI